MTTNPSLKEADEKLRKKNFGVYKDVYGFKPVIDKDEGSKYYVESAKNGSPVLYIRNALPSGDLRMNSLYAPEYEAQRWAEKVEPESRKTDVLMLGFSTGVFLEALRKSCRPDTDYYIYEPLEGLFAFICAYIDLGYIINNKRVHIFINERQKASMVDIVQNDIVLFQSEVIKMVTPFYAENDEYTNICDQISRISIALRNYKKSRGRGALRSRMYAWTHPENVRFFTDLERIFPKNAPAVIVSAGPSLEKNADDLKGLKNHAFILATDRSLSTLKEHGIVPDAAISVDAEKSAGYLDYAFEKNIPIICSYQLNKEAQERSGFSIYFDALSYEKKLFGEKAGFGPPIDMGGNVAGGAFSVLKLLGVNTIILVGQDLAYLDGRHHADNVEDGMGGILEDDCIEVPGIDGESVTTNKMWMKFLDFFVRQIKQNPGLRVIDATEGGAYIEGSEVMTLKEASESIGDGEFDFSGMFGEISCVCTGELRDKANDTMDKWIRELDEIEEKSKELAEISRELVKIAKNRQIGSAKATRIIKRLDELRNSMYRMDMNALLEEYWVEDMYSIPGKVLIIENDEDGDNVFEQTGSYYTQLISDCRSLKEEFAHATGKYPAK